jgi:fatty-acyl-CoA synthase
LSRKLELEAVILGGERIEWATLLGALDAFGPSGLTATALMPAYGLAEATLTVTATPLKQAPRHLVLDGAGLPEGVIEEVEPGSPGAVTLVSCGPPCGGSEIVELTNGQAAEIGVRSPCLAEGYLGDEARTRERFRDGLLRTGDIGFVADGELYPLGRLDDLISIGGRKIHAREVEAAVERLGPVRAGCSTIVEQRIGGVQRLVLLIEHKAGDHDFGRLAEQAAEVAMAKAAVVLDECLFLEQGTLPKTPSGKIQRHRCARALEASTLEPVARVALASDAVRT